MAPLRAIFLLIALQYACSYRCVFLTNTCPYYLIIQILDDEIDPDNFRKRSRFHDVIMNLEYHMFTDNNYPEVLSVMFAALVAGTRPGQDLSH